MSATLPSGLTILVMMTVYFPGGVPTAASSPTRELSSYFPEESVTPAPPYPCFAPSSGTNLTVAFGNGLPSIVTTPVTTTLGSGGTTPLPQPAIHKTARPNPITFSTATTLPEIVFNPPRAIRKPETSTLRPRPQFQVLYQANELGFNLQARPGEATFCQVGQLPELRFAWSGLPQNQQQAPQFKMSAETECFGRHAVSHEHRILRLHFRIHQ